jgi:hypothetical protein
LKKDLRLKKDLCWGLFKDLAQLQTNGNRLIVDLTAETVTSVTGFSFIVEVLFAADIF